MGRLSGGAAAGRGDALEDLGVQAGLLLEEVPAHLEPAAKPPLL